jgi:hypothetical protein
VGQGQALALGNSAAGAGAHQTQMLMQLEAAMRMAWRASSSVINICQSQFSAVSNSWLLVLATRTC